MATLWTFGDSYTDFYYPPTPDFRHWRHEYTEWKGYNPKVYGEILAEKLNMKLVNTALGGCDNSYILEEFCKVCDKIQKNDIVIFGWTVQERFRLPNKNGTWVNFNPQPENEDGFFAHRPLHSFDVLSKNTVMEILINRTHTTISNELCNWIKLINFVLKDMTVIHWSWVNYYKICGVLYSGIYKSIKSETNGEVNDNHWCEDGHYEFAELLLHKINSGVKNLI